MKHLVLQKRSQFTLVELLVVIAVMAILINLLFPALKHSLSMTKAISCMNQVKQVGSSISQYCEDHDNIYPYSSIVIMKNDDNPISWDDEMSAYDGRNLSYTQKLAALIDRRAGSPTLVGGEEQYLCTETTPDANGSDRAYTCNYLMNRGGRMSVNGVFYPRGIAGSVGSSFRVMPSRTSDVPSTSQTILMTEVVSETGDRTVQLGSIIGSIDNPGYQTKNWSVKPYHKGLFNYLFCDSHVELLDPRETVGTGSLTINETSAKGMWTRQVGD